MTIPEQARPLQVEIAEQIARDASCAQGEFGQRVLSIIPYLTDVCDRASLVGVEQTAGREDALLKLEKQFAEDVADLEELKARGDLTKDYGEHSLYHARKSLERVRAVLALPPLRAREEIEAEFNKLEPTFTEDGNGNRLPLGYRPRTIEEIKVAILSRTAGQEWRAFDPAKLSDGELILCLEELRSRDTACLSPEPIVAEQTTLRPPSLFKQIADAIAKAEDAL